MNETHGLDIHAILKRLPHRYPFLLIDRVLDYVPGQSLRGLKNVTINEPFFQGHFPYRPVMPGVLILEAMAQATGILAFVSGEAEGSSNTLYYFVGIDKARFKKPVEPGDQLILEVNLERHIRGLWRFDAEARVGEEKVASASIMTTARTFDP
ncbi:MAG: 3-hydroxyacyl-[acyl-carrier-protein] dehydratase FabZ [Gammaproteobacteria bacterium]|nr:MAG: 3-hydroxyacyl-[acyl-carrier-protein] dehydratase FabZ [Gammaproteobacteria bacterium]